MQSITDTRHDSAKSLRRSIRLKEYDYSKPGAYFVTICVKGRNCVLATVQNANAQLSHIGDMVSKRWLDIPNHFPSVDLDAFVIMPNHLHGILMFNVGARFIVPEETPVRKRSACDESGFDESNPYIPQNPMLAPRTTLGKIIRSFKARATRQIRRDGKVSDFSWQRNYYEHIIRNEAKLNRIREYILCNPVHWEYDRENSERVPDNRYNSQWDDVFETVYGRAEQ